MKDLNPNIDETKIWQQSFPNFYSYAVAGGIFVIPETTRLMQQIMFTAGGSTKLERAISRLDLAMSTLWPKVNYLFMVDFFPHRLAAATDLLRAADFGEGPDKQTNALAAELAQALDQVERLMDYTDISTETMLRAAEDVEE